jgi:IS30 family transposase
LKAEERPPEIDRRERSGDVERDLIVGRERQGYLMTIVDRKTRFTIIKKIERPQASIVHKATVKALRGYNLHSITNDNGFEFTAYKKTSRSLVCLSTSPAPTPPRSVEQSKTPTNSSDNTLLNHRPRKLLGFKSPMEAAA